ncbi:hypothetical protein VaNZ11_011079 [Volvox africanus]|uniref:Ammonium transporter n=1 Tax=Volvox africanus TaxID=51714 RepID=A0ABQ5SBZ1_9CHLO|nr:hypothetical protein VaNZ11_011079 [Volvox africanus]
MSEGSSPAGHCSAEQYASLLQALHGDGAAATELCKIFTTIDRTEEVAHGLNTVFMVLSGALVFIMHGGFAMLEAGAIRSKNAMNILLQTVLDGAASAVMWYLVGFGFAYGIGDKPNGFIGDALFGLARYSSHHTITATGDWTSWFFQWAFCATAATIPAGAVAERFNFNAYLGYSVFLGGFVYPVVVHWVWCPTGWLGYSTNTPLLGAGMIDFAGSGVVHMTGGLAGLIGAWMVGPRMGRFDANGQAVHMPGHSAILVVLGTVLLWFGWYGFNPGSALVADTFSSAMIAGRAAVTSTLSGAAGGLSCLALAVIRHKAWDLTSLCNGVLVGLVSVTAGCTVYEPWAALLCGSLGAVLFEAACAVLLRLRIDDVVSAGPMHGICGAWGVLFVGLLAKEEYVRQTFADRDTYPYGLFYAGGGKLLASQVIGVLAIAGWVAGTMGPFFAAFKFARSLRISAEDESMGLDASKHGGSAYNIPMQRYIGGFGEGPAAGENSNRGVFVTPPYTNSGIVGGGVGVGCIGSGRAVGDAIMRGVTFGGSTFIVNNTGGVGTVSGGNVNITTNGSAFVTPFDGLNGILSTRPISSPAVSAVAGHTSGGPLMGTGGTDSSVGSEGPRIFCQGPVGRQQQVDGTSPSCSAPTLAVAADDALQPPSQPGKQAVPSVSEDPAVDSGGGHNGDVNTTKVDVVCSGASGCTAAAAAAASRATTAGGSSALTGDTAAISARSDRLNDRRIGSGASPSTSTTADAIGSIITSETTEAGTAGGGGGGGAQDSHGQSTSNSSCHGVTVLNIEVDGRP